MEFKTGQYSNIKNWQVQTWGEHRFTWQNGQLVQVWEVLSDWKPVPFAPGKDGPGWEPVFHAALTDAAIYLPGFGASVWKLDRATGAVLARIQPFGSDDPNRYAVGPLSADAAGNIYYNALKLATGPSVDPWTVDTLGGWLVKIDAAGTSRAVDWGTLVPGTPAATDQCLYRFPNTALPWPPSPSAVPPSIACGS